MTFLISDTFESHRQNLQFPLTGAFESGYTGVRRSGDGLARDAPATPPSPERHFH